MQLKNKSFQVDPRHVPVRVLGIDTILLGGQICIIYGEYHLAFVPCGHSLVRSHIYIYISSFLDEILSTREGISLDICPVYGECHLLPHGLSHMSK